MELSQEMYSIAKNIKGLTSQIIADHVINSDFHSQSYNQSSSSQFVIPVINQDIMPLPASLKIQSAMSWSSAKVCQTKSRKLQTREAA